MKNGGRGPQDLDQIDLQILQILRINCKNPSSTLAVELKLSQSSCWKRVRRLENLGYIKGYHAVLDHELLGDIIFEGSVDSERRTPRA